jgi:hypothetical protein
VAGVYDFTASTTTGATTTLDQGPAFTLTAGDATLECARVASSAASLQNVTVTQVGAPVNTMLADLTIYRFFTGTNTFDDIQTVNSPAATVQFGNDYGWVLVFRNVAQPPVTGGCTLTQGYWKNHSEKGPAPYNDTWALLTDGADTEFFSTGASWYDVFHTPVAGNQYYNLAHQYMAAVLNGLAGASAPQEVSDAIADAEALFGTYTPAQVGAMRGNNPVRQEFVALAGLLDSYNRGLIGPGHCTG